MNTTTSRPPLKETFESLGDLLKEGVELGLDMFDTLKRSQSAAVLERALRVGSFRLPRAGVCHVPPPCWMPKALGEVVSHVCPGGTATLRIRVTNCSITQREVRIIVPDDKANVNVNVNPPILQLYPMERDTSVLSVTMPADAGAGTEREFLVWVSGCLNHYLRWTVRAAKRGADCCHEVEVEDCQDYIHHWYDHFYCPRPCQPRLPQR